MTVKKLTTADHIPPLRKYYILAYCPEFQLYKLRDAQLFRCKKVA
jgi:hypothetical protein